MQGLGRRQRAGRVMGQQRRHLQRDPPIDTAGALENRHEQVSRPGQILQRQIEKQVLAETAVPAPRGGSAAS